VAADVEIPTTYSLDQNYPNPFNPNTTIQFELPVDGAVRLVVVDLLGREMATLIAGRLSAGAHHVDFNADSLPSGLYVYRLETPSTTLSRTMTLVK
jgi:hypothetical protein